MPFTGVVRLDVQRGYSRVEAAVYERWLADGVRSAVAPLLVRIAADLPAEPQLADVGCGGGQLIQALKLALPALRPVGIDPSAFELGAARRRLSEVALIRASATNLPFRRDSFDATVSICSIKHWPDRARGLHECARITKPGGLVVIVELDGDATLRQWRRFIASTAVPRLAAAAYASVSHRLVVRWSATARELSSDFSDVGVSDLSVARVPDQPMIYAVATVI